MKTLKSIFLSAGLFVGAAGLQAQNPDIKWIEVQGGTYTIGSGSSAHKVVINTFYMSATEITFDQYDAYCTATGTKKPDDLGWGRGKRPVLNVSWNNVTGYCQWLSKETEDQIRLPDEAEWEYAATGGNRSKGYKYSGSNDWKEVSWSEGNSGGKTRPVGEKKPNELGLYDMSGNLWEMCEDWPVKDSYSVKSGKRNEDIGAEHAAHGNSYDNPACDPRQADVHVSFDFGHSNVGFRIVKAK